MTGYSIYNGYGELLTNWQHKSAAVAAAKALKQSGTECGHYVVNERNAQLVWSA